MRQTRWRPWWLGLCAVGVAAVTGACFQIVTPTPTAVPGPRATQAGVQGRPPTVNTAVPTPGVTSSAITPEGQQSTTIAAPLGVLPVGDMAFRRAHHTATLLADGRVLVAGGFGASRSAELYDPDTRTFTATGNLTASRVFHSATRLQDGSVLIVGGCDVGGAETYDPASGTFRPVPGIAGMRAQHSATPLPDGTVLIAGGRDSCGEATTSLGTAVLYDPATGAATPIPGGLAEPRQDHQAALLPDGRVLIIGGQSFVDGSFTGCISSVEAYDPKARRFQRLGATSGSDCANAPGSVAPVLPSGKVFVRAPRAELFDAATGSSSPGGALLKGMGRPSVTLLPSGTVLLAGGFTGSRATDLAQLYDPELGGIVDTIVLPSPLDTHTATLLRDGSVLITGGNTNPEPNTPTAPTRAAFLITARAPGPAPEPPLGATATPDRSDVLGPIATPTRVAAPTAVARVTPVATPGVSPVAALPTTEQTRQPTMRPPWAPASPTPRVSPTPTVQAQAPTATLPPATPSPTPTRKPAPVLTAGQRLLVASADPADGGTVAVAHRTVELGGQRQTVYATPPPRPYVMYSPLVEVYSDGDEVVLAALANDGYAFVEWTGDCAGSGCSLRLDRDRSVTARFARQ